MKVLKSLGLPNKISSCEVSALKINNTVEHDANSILEGFKNYYSTLAENLVNMLPKAPNKYSINTVIKYYEHMIQGSHFNLASVSKNSVLTILKSTQLSKFYKKVSLIQPFNYRPISLLPLIPKVIEKTSTFLNSKKLLYTYQSGF